MMIASVSQDVPMPDGIEDATVKTLASVLADGEAHERSLAVRALGKLTGSRVVSLLIGSLHDPDPDVRHDVANALGGVGDRTAIEPLIDNLRNDPVGEIKPAYIRALAALSARQTVPLLVALTTGRAEKEGVSWENEVTDWDDWFDVQYTAIEALGRLGDGSQGEVDAILQALNDTDGQDVSALATKALSRLGVKGCAALDNVVQHAPDLLCKRVAAALVEADAEDAAPLLAKLANDDSPAVRIAALASARTLGLRAIQLKGLNDHAPEVRAYAVSLLSGTETKALATALHDLAPEVRASACTVIERAKIGQPKLHLVKLTTDSLRTASPDDLALMVSASAVADPAAAVPMLEDIANHPATARPVRRSALRALGDLGTKKSVDLLTSAAADAQRDIRLEAIAALGRLARSDSSEKQRALSVLSNAIEGTLIALPDDFEPSSDNVIRLPPKRGAEAAGEDRGKRVQLDREGDVIDPSPDQPEISKSEDPTPFATSTLASILATPVERPPSGAENLTDDDLDMLELTTARPGKRRLRPDDAPPAHLDVRRLAVSVVGVACDASLLPALAIAVADSDHDLSLAAMESLREIAPSGSGINAAAESLLMIAKDSNQALRRSAILTLGKIRTEAADDAVREALRDPVGSVRAAACKACSGRSPLIAEAREMLRNADPSVRNAAANLIADTPDAQSIDDLLDFAIVENGEHRMEASKLLSRFGAPVVHKLLDFIGSPDARKRLIALEMLPECLLSERHGV